MSRRVSERLSLTEQSKLLGRFTRKVVVNYDGDKAGIKAARRAIEPLLLDDFEIKILILPDGQDPDDYLKANGTESYNQQRGQAFPFLQFVLEDAVREQKSRSAESQSRSNRGNFAVFYRRSRIRFKSANRSIRR